MTVFVFLLLFHLPSFGGPVRVEFAFTDLDACDRMQRTVVRQMREMSLNTYELVECHEEAR